MIQFSEQKLAKVAEIISRYPEGKQKSALLPVLHLTHDEFGGWLDVPVMDYVATLLKIEPIEVYEVASFYSMYNLKPVGKYHIQICGTTPCWLKGAEDIIQTCEKRIGIKCGNTSVDGRFTISEVECLGACANAPMLQVNG